MPRVTPMRYSLRLTASCFWDLALRLGATPDRITVCAAGCARLAESLELLVAGISFPAAAGEHSPERLVVAGAEDPASLIQRLEMLLARSPHSAATMFLVLAGAFAGYFPARAAARVNPIHALRDQ